MHLLSPSIHKHFIAPAVLILAGLLPQIAFGEDLHAVSNVGLVQRPQVIRSISHSGGDSIMAVEMINFLPATKIMNRPTRSWSGSLYPRSVYFDEIALAVTRTGVDEALLRSVIHAESSFQRNALSPVGAQGLMQLMPATARRFGVNNAYDPAQNILGGANYLSWLLRRYRGDTRLAVAAYNAGEGAVDRYGGIPPYQETMNYVDKVASLLPKYRQIVR